MNAEAAIRHYLTYLDDPSQLVDDAEVSKLEAAVQSAVNPLEKLKALAALDRARAVDGQSYRDDFVRVAKEWSEREGVPASAFRQMAVPDDVLRDAGFDVAGGRRRGATGSRRRSSNGARTRSRPVSTDEIQTWVLGREQPFTTSDIAQGAGGSPITIKKVLDELVASGKVNKLGPVKDWPNRGRVPMQYALSS
jgi:hypothetical protein